MKRLNELQLTDGDEKIGIFGFGIVVGSTPVLVFYPNLGGIIMVCGSAIIWGMVIRAMFRRRGEI